MGRWRLWGIGVRYGVFVAVAACLALSGCGIAMQIQAQEQAKKQAAVNAQLVAQSDAAKADCDVKFPPGNAKQAVVRRKCLNDAFSIRLPTLGADQDLAQAVMADAMVIAEKVQNGKMTIAEGNAAIAERWSQAVSESQQRANARNSVMAEQNAAAAQQQAAAAANTAAFASMIQATKPPPITPVVPVVNPSFTCTHFPGSPTTTCN
jgi:hypothetical protein